MERDRADRGLAAATQTAVDAIRGLISDGPVAVVTAELDRLHHEAEVAEGRANRWERIGERLDAQASAHQAETDDASTALRAAGAHAASVRAEVTKPLRSQAQEDGREYLNAVTWEAGAAERLRTVGRFERRRAHREQETAQLHTRAMRGRVREEWGQPACR